MSTFTECYGAKVSEGVAKLEQWIQDGCQDGIEEKGYCHEGRTALYYDSTELPDLSGHNNFICDLLKEKPELWDKFMKCEGGPVKTSKGNTLAHCLKTGIDNKGHPNIKTVGLVACDEECFEVFKEIFDPVISARHNGYEPDAKHVTNMNPDDISATKIDPDGKYLLTARCRTGRSITKFHLPPTVGFLERREQEKLIVEGLGKMEGELKGEYLPLRGNKSGVREDMKEGMNEEQEEALRKNGNLFQEPDSTLLLSSGCGRHWPDARGIFKNEAENFFVWCNEEDQMRIVSMEKGDNIHAIFTRFANATKVIEETFAADGRAFMKNDHLGYVLTCPSNLGTGLRAGAIVEIPKFSSRKDFKGLLAAMKLQARGTAGVDSVGGTKFDISNADRLGYSEVDLVNRFIEGVAQIILWEKELQADEKCFDEEGKLEGLIKEWEKKLLAKEFKTHGDLAKEKAEEKKEECGGDKPEEENKPEEEKSTKHKEIEEAQAKDAEVNKEAECEGKAEEAA